MAKVFFSYSHADEALRDELEKHLSILKRQGVIETWHDRRIIPGAEFESTISTHLEEADIIILLISSDFLASDYCYDIEMKIAMERHECGDAVVIPVILHPSDWHETPFGKLLAATKDGKPVIKFPTLDDAFLEVVGAIKNVAGPRSNEGPSTNSTTPDSQIAAPRLLPRTSNLRIKKSFTDHDRDLFLESAYDYICNFFEGSLEELGKRHPGIQTRFTRIDVHHFSGCSLDR